MHNEGMTNIPGKRPPDNGLFSTFHITNKGTVLWNLRFWVAAVIGVFLLLGGAATYRQGPGLMIVWAVFTVAWLGWTLAIGFIASPTCVAMVPEDPKPSDRMVTLPALTPEQEALWEKGKPTPLTPEQREWVEGKRTPPYDHKVASGEARARAAAAQAAKKPAEKARPTPSKSRKRYPAPAPQPYGVDHQGAEVLAAEWMRHLGVADATATRHVGDGGIDVDSKLFVAQVKHGASSIGAPDLQRLAGVAAVAGKHAVFFVESSYTPFALTFAEDARMALFTYNAHAGTLRGENALGRAALTSGRLKSAFEEMGSAKGTAPRTPRA